MELAGTTALATGAAVGIGASAADAPRLDLDGGRSAATTSRGGRRSWSSGLSRLDAGVIWVL
jgi:hypothetical protein